MKSGTTWLVVSAVVFLSALFALNWQSDRTAFGFISISYSLAFIAYLFLIKASKTTSFKSLALIAIFAQVISMIFIPNLTVDHFRFIWDGEITWLGYNPFDFTPKEMVTQSFMSSEYMQDVYSGMSTLSTKNYSCYPPFNQLYFLISTALTESIWGSIFVMKSLIFLSEIVGAIYLRKLLIKFGVHENRMWLLYLNPLWIIEATGNTHFEGVMLSFLIIAFYFLHEQKWLIGSIFFALAVQMKLIPLLFLPFFIRYIGWKEAFKWFVSIGVIVFGIAATQINWGNIRNFGESLALYFSVFEFNSFIFYNTMKIGKLFFVYNPIRFMGPILSLISMSLILRLAFKSDINNWKDFFQRLLFAFFIYLILSGTLHPWYILPLLTVSIFTNFSFPVWWTFLIFFSYFFYSIGSGSSWEVRTLITVEYLLLFLGFMSDWRFKGSRFDFLRLDNYFQPSSTK